MKIINTYKNILHCFPDDKFCISTWRKYADQIYAGLAEKCENDSSEYDFENQVLPVLNQALQSKDKLKMVNDSFTSVGKLLKKNIRLLFDKDIDLDIILYLGLCNGAGWATALDDKNVILLGIEKIIELDWCDISSMQGLIFHEIGHIWHKTYGNLSMAFSSQKEKSILQLYQEGIAMICEELLSGKSNFFHQDKNGWRNWCQANEKEIKCEYFNRLNKSQDTQDFFGDWCSYKGYSDVGYYIGCQFIKYLQSEYSLIEIANLPTNALLSKFGEYVKLA